MKIVKLLPQTERQAHQWIIIFSLIILLLAVAIGSFRNVGTFSVESDFYGVYAVQAERILNGEIYTYQHNPPGYCLLLAGISIFIGNSFVAAKLISAVSLALLALVIYALMKTIVSYQLAFCCTLLSITTLFPASFLAAMDLVSTLVILLPVCLFLRSSILTNKTVFICGNLAGFAYLFRTNAIFVPIGIIISLLLINFQQEIFWKRLIKVSFFMGGFILIVSPWLIYNLQVNGSFFNSTAYLQIAANFYHPEGDYSITSLAEMGIKFNSLTEVILHHPLHILRKYLQEILFFNIPKLFIPLSLIDQFPALIIFPLLWVGTGLILFLNELKNHQDNLYRQKNIAFLMIFLFGYLLLGLVSFHRRYYFFIYPCVFLLKLYPLIKLECLKFRQINPLVKRIFTYFFIFSLFTGVTLASGIETYLTLRDEPKYLLVIAEYLKASSSPNEIMIIRKPHLAYLANLTPTFPLANTANEYISKAKEIGAKYVVYSDYEASLWSGLNSLSSPKNLPPSLQLIYHYQPTNTLIYQINSKHFLRNAAQTAISCQPSAIRLR
ncbi:MAG: glycosyltransferase family 39 protein [Okeania sp. SIO3B5]|uniref:glycosyltransferase family 39 protein n=1 Tax=Okeania sp. SIO3B5 TaxID=2607811 RepID=UPI0013FF314A|nr:glycosyltransferase family 39 protein [Okeania sp. SIO3B5]NEO54788.1 glycosyltransferase family 39 protein [Okeania sp. SIO3B5]